MCWTTHLNLVKSHTTYISWDWWRNWTIFMTFPMYMWDSHSNVACGTGVHSKRAIHFQPQTVCCAHSLGVRWASRTTLLFKFKTIIILPSSCKIFWDKTVICVGQKMFEILVVSQTFYSSWQLYMTQESSHTCLPTTYMQEMRSSRVEQEHAPATILLFSIKYCV